MGPFDFMSDLFNSNKQPDPVQPDPQQAGMDGLPPLPQAPPSYRTNAFEPAGGNSEALAPFALVGRMLGMPTTAERGGMVNQQAQQELAKRVEQGMPIDKAIMDFIGSPKGSAWMGSGVADVPGVLKTFSDSILTRPPIQSQPVNPGQQVTRTTTSGPNAGTETINQPHAPMQVQPSNTVTDPNAVAGGGKPFTAPPAPMQVSPEHTVVGPEQQNGTYTAPPGQRTIGSNQVLTAAANPGENQQGSKGPQYVPPEQVSTFNEMTKIANLPESTLRELATMQAMTPEGRMGRPIQLALKSMVETGSITQEQASRFLAGSAQILENKTGYGPKFFFYDKLDGPAGGVKPLIPNSNYQPSSVLTPQMPVPGQGETLGKSPPVGPAGPQPQGGTGYPVQGTQPQGSNTPTAPAPVAPGGAQSPTLQADVAARAQPPSQIPSDIPSTAYKPDGSVDWSKAGPRAQMFLGVGPGANFTDFNTRVTSAILGKTPSSMEYGRTIEAARSQMRNFQQVVMSMAKEGNQMNVPKDLTEHVKNLVEGMNLFDDPVASAIQMKTLSNRLTSEIKGNMASLANEEYASQDQQKIWEHQINMYRQVLRTMPSPEDTDTFIRDYNSGKVRASAATDIKNAFTNSMEIVDQMRSGGISPAAEAAAKTIATATNSKELMAAWEKSSAGLTPAEKNRLSPLMANRANEIIAGRKNGLEPGESRVTPAPKQNGQRVPTKTSPGDESDASKAINRNQKADSKGRTFESRYPDEFKGAPDNAVPTREGSRVPSPPAAAGPASVKTVSYPRPNGTPQETTAPAPQPKPSPTPAAPVSQPATPQSRINEGFTPFSRAAPEADDDGSGSSSFAPLAPKSGSLQDFMRGNVQSIEHGPKGVKITFGRSSGASKNKPTPFARVL